MPPKLRSGSSGGGGSSGGSSGGGVSIDLGLDPGPGPEPEPDPVESDPTPEQTPSPAGETARATAETESDPDPGRLPDAERETTETGTMSNHDRLDLGQYSSGGGTNYDLGSGGNAGAVVDTPDIISDAGGPEAVLAGNYEQLRETNEAISDVAGALDDAQQATENAPSDALPDNVPAPSTDGMSGRALAVGVGIAALAVGVVFG